MLAVVSNDAVLGAAAGLLGVLITAGILANLRSNRRLETSVETHAQTAKDDTAQVAHAVTEVRVAQAETNGRLHDARERLARLEGAQQFAINQAATLAAGVEKGIEKGVATVVEAVEGNGHTPPDGG